MVNLTPKLQQPQFHILFDGDLENKLNTPQIKKLDDLKNLIVHGKPLDSNHPGVINLSPD